MKRLFKKFSPGQKYETPPRLLRQSFITVCAQQGCPHMMAHAIESECAKTGSFYVRRTQLQRC